MSADDNEAIPVRVTVADPWDFTSNDGSNEFPFVTARARTPEEGAVLLGFGAVVATGQGSARFFVATPTNEGTNVIAELLSGVPIDCSLIGVSDEAAADRPIEAAAAWRGGYPAARATVSLA